MIIYSANGSSEYNLTNSLRFRSSASAYLSRTFSTPTSSTIWTWSAWVKRGQITGTYRLFGASTTTYLTFNSSDQLNLTLNGVSAATSTAVFRDSSAWYHIVYTQNGSSQTIYVNNASVATGTTAASIFNTAIAHQIGATNTSNYLDGYMTEVNFIDGQALTPSSFGSTNATTGVWQPAKYTGTYGTNGFYLNFNSIALTSGSNTGLGKDNSGNGNYWNTNNISVTAGTTYDAMTDVPTLTSTNASNYCTLNPATTLLGAAATLSNGNLRFTPSNTNWMRSFGTISVSSGKWYWEVTGNSSLEQMHGILLDTAVQGYAGSNNWVGFASDGYGYYTAGTKWTSNSGVSYGASYTTGDVIGVALDLDAGTLIFYKNNVSQGTAFTGLSGNFVPAVSVTTNAGANSCDVNFGQQGFKYTPPTGYKALNTYNLPTPTIPKGNKYMDATTYTGTGASNSITNASGFKPDLVWVKGRSGATSHALYDSVRGTTIDLVSDSTAAETTQTTGLTAFGTGGFTVGALAKMNTSAATYVGWQWQAGQGSTSSNTNGSITSTVSVNATAGFSVVTYTGTGANATVGHGLGVAPKMVIVKNRGSAVAWTAWHTSIANTEYLVLNTTAAVATGATWWNSTTPTSSVFSVGTSTSTNASTNTYVVYCWAEIAGFSKFGFYTGNGLADGSFVYTGFRPKFIMIKRADVTANWVIMDGSRNTYNQVNLNLNPNSSGAEESIYAYEDFLSNGFKLRTTDGAWNASGGTYIYMAFAENPFKYANAR
jgi:hypothetical protein